MVKVRFFQSLAIAFLLLYLGVAFAGWVSLDTLFPYADYVFKAVFGGVILALFPKWEWKKGELSFGAGVVLFFAFASGFAVYEGSGVLGLSMPFALKDPETVLILLVVGPILEEWIFRGALWKLIEVITGSPWPAYLTTAVLFSYGYYYVITAIDPQFSGYVRYQAIYSLGLGLLCGGMRLRQGWRAAVFTHLSFNFGFWLGSL